jgi:pimeloyl-ACP methyl ester carboxylesterase
MKETSLRFGPDSNLIGTVARPAVPAPGGLGVLLLNAGIISRIGPHRLNVRLARYLAERGIPSLRFDAAGLGDSGPSSSGLPWERQAVADLRAAMDCLEKESRARRFAVIGLCSGADTGYATALEDERIAALVMIDPYIYPTLRSRMIHLTSRIRERGPFSAVGSWARRQMSRASERLRSASSASSGMSLPRYSRNAPSRDEFGNNLQRLKQRGVGIYMIYTGGARDYYNHQGQFASAFSRWPFASQIQCEYVPAFDHMITAIGGQRLLLSKVAGWLDREFAELAPTPAATAQASPAQHGVENERQV